MFGLYMSSVCIESCIIWTAVAKWIEWEESVEARERVDDAEKAVMLLSIQTSYGLKMTGTQATSTDMKPAQLLSLMQLLSLCS